MGSTSDLNSVKPDSAEELPSLFKYVESKAIDGFDSIERNSSVNTQSQMTGLPPCPSPDFSTVNVIESTILEDQEEESQSGRGHHVRAVSISMPSSPLGVRRVLFSDEVKSHSNAGSDFHAISMVSDLEKAKQVKYHSQPMSYKDASGKNKLLEPSQRRQKNPTMNNRLRDKRFDSFKTWSGKLERQISHLRGKPQELEPEPEMDATKCNAVESMPVDRYFDALEGPELDTLKASEELVLPEDKQWPFLLRYPISSFGVCLGVSSQAILWKTLATSSSTSFLHINLDINLVLWCIAVAVTAVVSSIYTLKIIFYFEAVRREYYHPIRVNFFFAPWIAFLFLALGLPPSIVKNLHSSLWYILMAPIFCLELKLYGQWMSGGKRRLSKVANPSNHLSIVGNFVGALLGASMGLKEGPIFFFAVGLAHYLVLFVTLYQRLPTNETLPKELHPVFFLFVAAPSVASMAWAKIEGSFDYGARICYFIALFLYFSLAVRVNFFRGFKFSLAWWAYTFPMTGAAIATIRYANEIKSPVTQALAVVLSFISTITVSALLISTLIHAFVLRDLFPNDIAIAISRRRTRDRKHGHIRSASTDTKPNDPSLRTENSIDTSLKPTKPVEPY